MFPSTEQATFIAAAFQVIAQSLITRLSSKDRRGSEEGAMRRVSETVANALMTAEAAVDLSDDIWGAAPFDRNVARMVDRLVMFHLVEANPRKIELAQEQLAMYIARAGNSGEIRGKTSSVVKILNDVVTHSTTVIRSSDEDVVVRLPTDDVGLDIYQDAIVRRLDAWNDTSDADWSRHNEAMRRLASQTYRHFGFITPPDPDRNRKVPIEDLYVAPELSVTSTQFLESSSDTVLLGDPGAGKSTVIRHLAHRIAKRRAENDTCPDVVVIRLKDYSDYITQREKLSLLEFSAEAAKVTFQLEDMREHLQRSANSGNLVLCVDGLDEVVDVPSRRRIVEAVEAFSGLYPDCRVVVSSREAGYRRAEVQGKSVLKVSIAPFDRERVAAYATKWFAIAVDAEDRQRTIDGFILDAEAIPDIASNPLMLSLLCLLYRGQGTLPESRPEVYWQCSELMYRRWDTERGIELGDQLGVFIRPAVEELAFSLLAPHLYPQIIQQRARENDGSYQEVNTKPMSESAILERIAQMLEDWKYDEEPAKARELAQSFLRHCCERSWVLVPAEERWDGEVTYEFAHRTFQEFLVAAYFVRSVSDYNDFERILLSQFTSPEWDVIVELALQIKAARVPSDVANFIDGAMDLCDAAHDAEPSATVEDAAIGNVDAATVRKKLLGAAAYLDLRQSTLRRLAAWILPSFTGRGDDTWRFALRAKLENAKRLATVIEEQLQQHFESTSIQMKVEQVIFLEQLLNEQFEREATIDEVGELWKELVKRLHRREVASLVESTASDTTSVGDFILIAAVARDSTLDVAQKIGLGDLIGRDWAVRIRAAAVGTSRSGIGEILTGLRGRTLANYFNNVYYEADDVRFDRPVLDILNLLRDTLLATWSGIQDVNAAFEQCLSAYEWSDFVDFVVANGACSAEEARSSMDSIFENLSSPGHDPQRVLEFTAIMAERHGYEYEVVPDSPLSIDDLTG